MSKKVLFFVSLFFTISLNAQLPFTFGPKMGFTTSKLSTNKQEITEAFTANMYGGIFVRIGDKSFLQTEVNFTTKGGLFQQNELLQVREIELNTIEIPVLLGAKSIDLRACNLRMMIGPSISFITDKEILMRSPDHWISQDKIKDAIWSLQAGIGVDLLMLSLDIRYELGLNNISNIEGIEMKNALFHVSLGWKIL